MKHDILKFLWRYTFILTHVVFLMGIGFLLEDIGATEGSGSVLCRLGTFVVFLVYMTWDVRLTRNKEEDKDEN